MVPRIAQSGHSFKGAGLYYLHDKESHTTERVAWTYTHNIATNDPDKAFRYMAHTAMRADDLKRLSGVATTGRKRTAGVVYSFSIAWHPEQEPERNTMQNSALDILTELGLADHEAVFVCHTDTAHPHVHVIANLIHPETGRKAVPSYDYLTASKWAEKLERETGKIYCEQRVINNEQRRELAKENRQLANIKHREKPHEQAKKVQELYNRSDSGKAFQAALKSEGLTLAQGDRRGFVLVDNQGKILSLSRQLKGQRARDIKAKLAGLEHLPSAQELADQRAHFDRDHYETEFQKGIVDAAIEHSDNIRTPNPKKDHETPNKTAPDTPKSDPQNRVAGYREKFKTEAEKGRENSPDQKPDNPNTESDDYLKRLDALRAWEQKISHARARLETQQASYGRADLLTKIAELERQLNQKPGLIERLSNKRKNMAQNLEALKRTLDNIDQRIAEQNQAFKQKAERSRPSFDPDPEREKRLREIKQQWRDASKNRDQGQSRDNDLGPEI